jgi:transposase
MANYLKVDKRQQVLALLELCWSYRRIERETGVRRETIAGYDCGRRSKAAKVFAGSAGVGAAETPGNPEPETPNPAKVTAGWTSNAAKVFAGSEPRGRSSAIVYQSAIEEKLKAGLTAQRIWQDLVGEYGYAHSYESVKRYVRKLRKRGRVVGVYHTAPGEEAQVDFFRGAPSWEASTGQWKLPWVFRMTLSHSRHGYEETVWDMKLETFLRLHENAFLDFGGVVKVVRHDNLKAGVSRACLYDPDSNEVYTEFAKHWGFVSLPGRPGCPQDQGKEERSGGYVKDNALKGRRFPGGLKEQNEHLRHWNRTVARLRIHGTTRKQVWTHFLESDRPALQPLPAQRFALFACGTRTVHVDGHVEVNGAFYPAPAHLLGEALRVRYDQNLVRLYHRDTQLAVFVTQPPGTYAPAPGASPLTATYEQQAFVQKQLGRCRQVGEELHAWAESALQKRGVRAIRLIQGALHLTRKHPRERVLHAARLAQARQCYRYKDLRRLVENADLRSPAPALIQTSPHIRPLSHYRLEELTDDPR